MLSRVIPGRDAARGVAKVQPAVFAPLGLRPSPVAQGQSAASALDEAGLREKIQQIENRAVAEKRQAYDAGRQEGEQKARAEMQPVLDKLNQSCAEVLG